jgi:alkyldihydroxyacetonephosphate synthase
LEINAMPTGQRFTPRWINRPPAEGSSRAIFKWGAPNVFKHPNRRLYSLLKEKLELGDADFKVPRHLGNDPPRGGEPSRLPPRQLTFFKDLLGPENVSTDNHARIRFSTGQTVEENLILREGQVPPLCDGVLHPRRAEDVRRIVAYCHQEHIPVHVCGGRSSVNRGFTPSTGGVVLAMATHMKRVLEFNACNQTITVEPGISGPAYEAALNDARRRFGANHAFTGGHFPQSFEFSTVGGWIAALGSGQQSSYYGDAYDMVVSQELVTPTGTIKTLSYPACATGPKINDLIKGSEGTLGVLVAVTMKVFRYYPDNRKRFAFIFPSWHAGVEALRQIAQGEFGMPSVCRLSDPDETLAVLKLYGLDHKWIKAGLKRFGYRCDRRCLLIGQADGENGFCQHIKKMAMRICRRAGALYLTGYPVHLWARGRFKDPYLRDDLNDYGIIIDTLESAVTWDNLLRLHHDVCRFIQSRPATLCLSHISHLYPQGANLYFIFISRFNDLTDYKRFQSGIIDQTLRSGGSLSHHHGVGKMLASWLPGHLGLQQMALLRTIKDRLDPHRIMNPGGTLSLDRKSL